MNFNLTQFYPVLMRTIVWFLFSVFLAEGLPLLLVVGLAFADGLSVANVLDIYLGYSTPQLIAFGILMAVYGDHIIDDGCSFKAVTKWHVLVFLFVAAQLVCVIKSPYVDCVTSPIDLDRDFAISAAEINDAERVISTLDHDGDNSVSAKEFGYPTSSAVILHAVPALLLFVLAVCIKREDWMDLEEKRRRSLADRVLGRMQLTVAEGGEA